MPGVVVDEVGGDGLNEGGYEPPGDDGTPGDRAPEEGTVVDGDDVAEEDGGSLVVVLGEAGARAGTDVVACTLPGLACPVCPDGCRLAGVVVELTEEAEGGAV